VQRCFCKESEEFLPGTEVKQVFTGSLGGWVKFILPQLSGKIEILP